MLRGSRLSLFGQLDGEAREFLNANGSKTMGFSIRTPFPVIGNGWYDVYVYMRKSTFNVSLGD